jgi:lipoate synthase
MFKISKEEDQNLKTVLHKRTNVMQPNNNTLNDTIYGVRSMSKYRRVRQLLRARLII